MMCLIRLIAFGLCFTFSALSFAEEGPPWTHPDVLTAAVQINMTPEQRSQFRNAVSEFLQGFNADVQRLMKANNQTGLPRKIASKRRGRARAMNEDMAELLTQDQYPAYEVYRDTLLEKMDEAAGARRRRR